MYMGGFNLHDNGTRQKENSTWPFSTHLKHGCTWYAKMQRNSRNTFFQNTSLSKCNLTLWPCSFMESNLHNYPIITSENAIKSTKSTKLCIVNITWNAIMKLSSCDYESKCIYLTSSSCGHYKIALYVLVPYKIYDYCQTAVLFVYSPSALYH